MPQHEGAHGIAHALFVRHFATCMRSVCDGADCPHHILEVVVRAHTFLLGNGLCLQRVQMIGDI
eukprot:1160489-Pelagomonas_calceolata.AAC.4